MDEKFFENLARGKKAESEPETENAAELTVAESGGEHEMGSYEVELAKASASAVASRAASAAKSSRANGGKGDADEKEGSWGEADPVGQLTVDVYQTPDEIIVESAIAGVKPEDIDINVTSDSISIKGTRHREKRVADEDYLYQECYWGRFARSIILPQEIDPENADVAFRNGILTVTLPKTSKRKTRKLRVRID
jgi:HSP20 family protein